VQVKIKFKTRWYPIVFAIAAAVQCLGIGYRLVYEDPGIMSVLYFIFMAFLLYSIVAKDPGFKKMCGYLGYIAGIGFMATLIKTYHDWKAMSLSVGINDFMGLAVYSLMGFLLIIAEKQIIMPNPGEPPGRPPELACKVRRENNPPQKEASP
jgi:hypothetical protein